MCKDNELFIIDTHCHLQDEKLMAILPDVIERAKKNHVYYLICCGSSENDWEDVLEIANRYKDMVIPGFGLHPWYIKYKTADYLSRLEAILISREDAWVGECGLDFAVEDIDKAMQEEVFLAQIKMAKRLSRPISMHARRVFGMLPDILEKVGYHEPGIVIHSYSGPSDLIGILAKFNCYFSFSASITRTNNKRGRKSAEFVPEDRLLVESDAPDIPPIIRGNSPGDIVIPEINEPNNIVYTLQSLANIRGWSLEKTVRVTTENAKRLLRL